MNSTSPKRTHTHTDSLNLAAVFGFLQVLVQFDDPLLILLLLDPSDLLQLTGPLVFQHLPNTDKFKHQRSLNTINKSTGNFIWWIRHNVCKWIITSCTSEHCCGPHKFFFHLLCVEVLRGDRIYILVTQRVSQLVHHFIHFSALPAGHKTVTECV